jgi:hypothetical protein
MNIETILGIAGTGASLVGITVSFVVSIRKAKKEMEILARKDEAEVAARKKAEKERFYLTTAANLVVSAEKLALTGPQKKEYVMTWLENEAVKTGVEIDRALMSVAIERTILIMNDHRGKDVLVDNLLKEELEQSVKREQIKIQQDVDKAHEKMRNESAYIDSQLKKTAGFSEKAIQDVKSILKQTK